MIEVHREISKELFNMVCCCALAGTTACKNCNRRAEFQYPQYVIDYAKTNPAYMIYEGNRITELEHAIEVLNDKIDKLLEHDTPVASSDFPEKPFEGQYWTVGDKIFRYLTDTWVCIGESQRY